MWLNLDITGIQFCFRIRDYRETLCCDGWSNFTTNDLIVNVEPWENKCDGTDIKNRFHLNYSVLGKEILMSEEVKEIRESLCAFLDKKLESKVLSFIEDDLLFKFKGEYIDLEIVLQDDARCYTGNSLVLCFSEEEATSLLYYIEFVMKIRSADDPEIKRLIDNGIIVSL